MKIFGPIYERALAWSRHPRAPALLTGLSFAEAVVFPVPPEIMLAPMCLSQPKRAFWFAALSLVGSLFGAVLGYLLGHYAYELIKPLFESLGWIDKIDAQVPPEFEVHLILDNYGTHKTATIQRWLLKRPRFHLHFTPTSASWINLVERWFGLLTAQQLRRGVFRSTRSLETTIRNYIDIHNEQPKPFIWTKTADEILASVARFCQRTLETGH